MRPVPLLHSHTTMKPLSTTLAAHSIAMETVYCTCSVVQSPRPPQKGRQALSQPHCRLSANDEDQSSAREQPATHTPFGYQKKKKKKCNIIIILIYMYYVMVDNQ